MSFLTGSLRLARIYGVDIRAHWSWAAVFGLLVWTIADGGYFQQYTEWPLVQRWVLATLTVILFFVAVVAHELAHALVAIRHGLPVPAITLFAFGGAAILSAELRSASAEFRVAIVGPLTSALLGGLAAVLWYFLQGTPAGTMSGYLAVSNLVLAAFNMLPGFPLDGGRVLRAAVWATTGNVLRATRVAGQSGSVVAWGLMLGGLAGFYWFEHAPGIWYLVIGFYLRGTSRRSYRELMSELMLRDIPTSELMAPPPNPIPAAVSVKELIDSRTADRNERAFLVQRHETIVGLLTLSDIVRLPRLRWGDTTVGAIMVPVDRVVTVAPDTGLFEAMRLMQTRDIRQLPVLDDGRLVGMVTRADVLRQVDTAVRRFEGGR